jgi:DNA-binding response OmpR family regulator
MPLTRLRRVLVVEDETLISMLYEDYLVKAGWSVTVVDTGDTALDAARTAAPEVVVLNLKLPSGPVGPDLLGQIRALRPFLPAVVVTGYELTDGERRALDLAGGGPPVGLLQKPADPDDLVAEVTRRWAAA